ESDAHFIDISGPELVSKFVGESEERLREIFNEAKEKAPTIIFMDEIDAIAPKREEATNEVERRMVSQLLTLMDGITSRGQVIVIGATNRPNAIDPALRRPGRFDREIEIGVPDRNARKEILQIHTKNMPLAKDVNLDELANLTHGYTGADIAALCREAAMAELRHILPTIINKKSIPNEVLSNLSVTRNDFMEALALIQPSALREVFVERPNVHWDDVGGLDEVKSQLKEAVELPVKNPEAFEKIGIRPVKGILLVGAPGTGKTLLAKAVATERESNFISIKGPELLSKYVGESEKAVREVFRKAKQAAPCIIFIDEIDAIASMRGSDYGDSLVTERVVDTLLTEFDGLSELKNVVVLAATNRPDIIDPALLRPGRFDKIIEIPLPDEAARLEIFKVHTKRMPLDKDVDLNELAKATENYTGAEIENIVREAGMSAIRAKKSKVSKHDFELALQEVRPAIPKELADRIRRFKEEPENMYR
ncbi:MAG: AAA family ATPase, partial [Candidatus Micrarchaeia archaeon]